MAVALYRRQGALDELMLISGGAATGTYKIWQATYNFTTQRIVPLSTPIPAVTDRHALWIELHADPPTEYRGVYKLEWTVGGTSFSWDNVRGDSRFRPPFSRSTHQILFWSPSWKDKPLTDLANTVRYVETLKTNHVGDSPITPLRNKNAVIKIGHF